MLERGESLWPCHHGWCSQSVRSAAAFWFVPLPQTTPRTLPKPLPSPLPPPAPLQSCARVELDHPMSDITRYPCSSYRPVEVQLARLNALSGLELSCPVSVLSNRDWEEAG